MKFEKNCNKIVVKSFIFINSEEGKMRTPKKPHSSNKKTANIIYEILSNEVFATAIISNNKHRQNMQNIECESI